MGKMRRLPWVRDETGLSDTTIWRQVRKGEFPAPVKLSGNAKGWDEDWITEWKQSRPRVHWAPCAETHHDG